MSQGQKVFSRDKTLTELMKEGWTLREVLDALEREENDDAQKQVLIEQKITDILQDIGIPRNIVGFYYLRKAIEMRYNHPGIACYRGIYPEIAKSFRSTTSRIERSIRYAIEVAWYRGNVENLHKYFGNTISCEKGKATNSEFIAMIADHLHLEDKAQRK